MRHGLQILVLCLSALLLPACGNYDKNNTPAGKSEGGNPRRGFHTVEILDMQFRPATLVVKKGDTVEWVNLDMLAHDVTEEPQKRWASGRLEAGATWRKVMDESADYYCSLHEVMKGKVTVEDAAAGPPE